MISVLSGLITMGSSKRISDIQISKGTTFEICNEHWAQNPLTGTNQKLLHPSSINTEKTANMLVGWICWILPPLVTGKPGYFLRRRKVNHRGNWSATLLGHLKVDTLRDFGRLESCGFLMVVCFVLSGFVSCHVVWGCLGFELKTRCFQAKWKSTHWGWLGLEAQVNLAPEKNRSRVSWLSCPKHSQLYVFYRKLPGHALQSHVWNDDSIASCGNFFSSQKYMPTAPCKATCGWRSCPLATKTIPENGLLFRFPLVSSKQIVKPPKRADVDHCEYRVRICVLKIYN